MTSGLSISIGQHSEAGRKAINQDFHGALVPDRRVIELKGIAVALADGISSSPVSQIAAESAVKSFLADYYCTSDAWSVKTAASRVIAATNSWLHAETRRSQHAYDRDKGYVCTLSAMVFKAHLAHLFHVGDSRIFRLAGGSLEQLTQDHRLVLSSQESYLGRALGMASDVEIDYREIELQPGDIFVLATDGIHGHVSPGEIAQAIAAEADLDAAARRIAQQALANGSLDNLTLQILRVTTLPAQNAIGFIDRARSLPPAPLPAASADLDGYRILRRIHASSRSHIYLATDQQTGTPVVLKIPSIDLRDDIDYRRRLAMEEWVARRLDHAHVLKAAPAHALRRYLYVATEYVEGQTLRQWMFDNPQPDLVAVRTILEQIARGLRAFHRKEMLHQDLRPENIMIDRHGTAKIIDFGSVRVAGVLEAAPALGVDGMLGTVQYAAPEYFLGRRGTDRSDQFSLGVIAYEMLTGRLPYGAQVARAQNQKAQMRLCYSSARDARRDLPGWIDYALRKAVDPDPRRRYEALSEFIADLRRPNANFNADAVVPLIERNPLLFWKGLSFLLALIVVLLLATRS